MTRFVQIHTLTSYPGVLLNRDDSGMAKRLPYGGTVRTRVSSQCLKRHWRLAEDDWALSKLDAPRGVRTRVVETEIGKGLEGEPALVEAALKAMVKHLYGNGEKVPEIEKRQALLLGHPEIEYLRKVCQAAITGSKDAKGVDAAILLALGNGAKKANLAAIKGAAGPLAFGLETALFGRMVTSDPAANADAAIHVAHAITVHKEESESDYFTVIDDLLKVSGGIFDAELTSGLFYGYVVVDVPKLVENLSGDGDLAAAVVEHLIHLIATVSPGAKKGSTAPYAYAGFLMAEVGDEQPRSLAGAFRKALPANAMTGEAAEDALLGHLAAFDDSYGGTQVRTALSLQPSDRAARARVSYGSLDAVAKGVATAVAAEPVAA